MSLSQTFVLVVMVLPLLFVFLVETASKPKHHVRSPEDMKLALLKQRYVGGKLEIEAFEAAVAAVLRGSATLELEPKLVPSKSFRQSEWAAYDVDKAKGFYERIGY